MTKPRTIPGEEARPTDVTLASTPARPERGRLHGADDPWGWAGNRGATLRTVLPLGLVQNADSEAD